MHQNRRDYKPLTEQPSWNSVKSAVQVLATQESVKYSSMTHKRKLKMKTHFETLDLMIETLAGSDALNDQKALVEDRLEKLHKHYKRFTWMNVKNLLKHVPTLEPFENSETQKKLNKYKYTILEMVAKKLSGYSLSNRVPLNLLLQSRFPNSFQPT